ncbi:hypothetical protein MO867_21570 [Microbulbifer sp. OS29]|uniref:Uncharacterized protein n=1 Tax=Microbulbifer okhotskensis TaxID=2926617 RepID=A0A9X2EVX6_9GAMM|nr:hypothetical protein [Microbulbifer okhotskensis]MCO1336921.1 hypothetical protein [Microbulbifer okhotskensis]
MENFIRNSLLPAATLLLALGTVSETLAATDSAQSEITLQFNETIQIERVDNITISDPIPGQAAQGTDTFCVAGSGFSTFSITFANLGTDPTFFLSGSAGARVDYDVLFLNSTTGPAPTLVMPGIPLNNQTLQASNCADDNARFNILIFPGQWEPVQNFAPFTGTLMITVASE